MAASVVIIIVNIITLRALYLNLPKVMCFFIFFIFLFFYFPPPLAFSKGTLSIRVMMLLRTILNRARYVPRKEKTISWKFRALLLVGHTPSHWNVLSTCQVCQLGPPSTPDMTCMAFIWAGRSPNTVMRLKFRICGGPLALLKSLPTLAFLNFLPLRHMWFLWSTHMLTVTVTVTSGMHCDSLIFKRFITGESCFSWREVMQLMFFFKKKQKSFEALNGHYSALAFIGRQWQPRDI